MSSSPTTKGADFNPFLGSFGWKEEWATQIDLNLSGWMSYPNSLM